MADEGRALDWDEEEVSDEGGFRLLDPGVYQFMVAGLEKQRYEGGAKIGPCPKAVVKLAVMTDAGVEEVRDSLLLHTKVQWRVARFFEGLGFEKSAETGKVPVAWNRIEGRTGWCEIGVREYDKKDGTKGRSNEVVRYLAPAEWPQQDAPAAAPQLAYQQPPLMQVPSAQAQNPSAGWSM